LIVERGISEHRARLIEQDTKTHRARVVQVPTSVLSELRDHLEANVPTDPEAPVFTTPAPKGLPATAALNAAIR
jgi:hypothetical protein